jgi:hypothetical protein
VVKLLWLPIRDIEDKNHDQDAQNAPRVAPKARSITSGATVAMRRATWAQIGPNDFSAQSHGARTPPPQSLIARPGVHDTTRPPIWGSRGREFKSRQPDQYLSLSDVTYRLWVVVHIGHQHRDVCVHTLCAMTMTVVPGVLTRVHTLSVYITRLCRGSHERDCSTP